MKKIISLLLATALAGSLAACGGQTPPAATEAPAVTEAPKPEATAAPAETVVPEVTEAPIIPGEATAIAEEDGQNPVMNVVGPYGAGRASLLVEPDGVSGAKIGVHWGSSAFEASDWTMSGPFDPDTMTVEYADGVRIDQVFGEDGDEVSSTVAYEGGTGRFIFGQDGSLRWEDDREHVADGTVFTFSFAGGDRDEAEYLGTWVYARATLNIVRDDLGYLCYITWANSAAEQTQWVYENCYFDGTGIISNEVGVKTTVTYGPEGNVVSAETGYTNGAAAFLIGEDGMLTWNDFLEDAGSGAVFEHVGQTVPAPTTEDLLENYFRPVGEVKPGASGASLATAQAACQVYSFASSHLLWAVDLQELRSRLLTAWESMSDEERSDFDQAFVDVVRLTDSCLSDWEGCRGTFADAGVADTMEALLLNPTFRISWSTLVGNTFTMGNSDEG